MKKGQGLTHEVLIGSEHHIAPGDKMESDISFIAPPLPDCIAILGDEKAQLCNH